MSFSDGKDIIRSGMPSGKKRIEELERAGILPPFDTVTYHLCCFNKCGSWRGDGTSAATPEPSKEAQDFLDCSYNGFVKVRWYKTAHAWHKTRNLWIGVKVELSLINPEEPLYKYRTGTWYFGLNYEDKTFGRTWYRDCRSMRDEPSEMTFRGDTQVVFGVPYEYECKWGNMKTRITTIRKENIKSGQEGAVIGPLDVIKSPLSKKDKRYKDKYGGNH